MSSPSDNRGIGAGVQETLKQRDFLREKFTDSRGYTLPYRMLTPTVRPMRDKAGPREIDPERMPLVLVLHGSGESGDDNSAQLRNGVAEFLGSEAAASRFPCYYVVPQCSPKHRWVEVDMKAEHHVIPAKPSMPLSAVVELLDTFLVSYPIDPQRQYLIGLSMGGFGVWDLLSRWPERFAAAVPICGGADESAVVAAQAMPIWAFHGAHDLIIHVTRSRGAVAALRAAGGTACYTEYPEVRHDAWTQTFAEPNLLPWLFAQCKSAV